MALTWEPQSASGNAWMHGCVPPPLRRTGSPLEKPAASAVHVQQVAPPQMHHFEAQVAPVEPAPAQPAPPPHDAGTQDAGDDGF